MQIKKISFLFFFAMFITASAFAQIDRRHAPKPGPAPIINIGQPDSFTLDNGLKVLVVENHKLPRINASLILKLDPILEKNKIGYTDMAGDILRRGTTTQTKAQLDEAIDFLGGDVSTGAKSASAFALTKNFDKVFAIMADVVLHPSFPADELEKIKTQTLSSLAQEKDDPSSMLNNVAGVLKFGKDHPYGEVETEQTVKNIQLGDLKNYYQTYWKPNVGYLVFVGDINKAKAKKLATQYFGKWQSGDVPQHEYAMPQKPEQSFIAIVDRPNAVQTNISITDPIKLLPGSPMNFSSNVMDQILGGGSNSRLFMNLREKHGYTYGSYSSISNDPVAGSFSAGADVRNAVTDSALQQIIFELNNIRNKPVNEEELDRFKNAISGSFARSLENPARIAQFALNVEMYNMPKDYYTNYLKSIAAVSIDDVQKAAQQYVTPDHAYIVMVGNAKDIVPQLTQYSNIKYYDMYGNEVSRDTAKALPAGLTAQEVIDHYLQAIGGTDKLKTVNDLTESGSVSTANGDLVITQKYLLPGKYSQEVTFPARNMTVVKITINDDSISMQQMGHSVPLDDNTKSKLKSRSGLFSEMNFSKEGYQLKLTGIEKVDGNDAYVVEVTDPSGNKLTNYYDVSTGYKLEELQTPGNATMGNGSIKVTMSDYKPVNGIMFPFTLVTHAGQQILNMKIQEIKINSGLKDEDF